MNKAPNTMKTMTFIPRPHQQSILDSLLENNKGIVQCPTGGGKTFAMICDARRHLNGGNVVVVVAPQLLLSQQLFNEFDFHLSDINFMWRQISSEAKIFQRNRKRLQFRVIPPEFATTVVSEIQETYRIAKENNRPLILFSTYKSLDRINQSGIPIETVYYDEAHNATEKENFKVVENLVGISTNNYFFTATPKLTKGTSDASGMNNESVYGKIINKTDFNHLIDQGIIVRPRLQLVKSTANNKETSEARINAKTIMEVVDTYEKRGEPNKILFNTQGTNAIRDIISNRELMNKLMQMGYNILAIDSTNKGYINGESGIAKDKFLKRLNEIGDDSEANMLVFHYSMLGEGIDVKAFNGVVFFRNSVSEIFTTQSIGRVIRKAPGKEYGCVTIIEHDSDSGEARSTITNVVRCLIEAGVPPEMFISGDDGRGDDSEVVEELPEEYLKTASDVAIEYNWKSLLSDLLEADVTNFGF